LETKINQNKNLCIHFVPGARGDFLGSVLLNNFLERQNGAVYQSNYTKIHKCFEQVTSEFDKNKYTFIRIDANLSIDNLMQIMLNGFLKNPAPQLEDYIDHFYTRAIDFFDRNTEIINPNNYDYWIDFSRLSDINFLEDLYLHYNQYPMDNDLKHCIEQNLKKQALWQTQPDLKKLSLLIDFEWKFNLFNWCKTFSIQEYMLSNDPKSLLMLTNYSKEPFVL
jgi:hypothetical protein